MRLSNRLLERRAYRLSREEFKELIVQAEVTVTPIIIIY